MKKTLLAAAAVLVVVGAHAAETIRTRLDHLSGTPLIAVISLLPSEITSITCESWTMLGINSWKHQNDFTIPPGPAVAAAGTATAVLDPNVAAMKQPIASAPKAERRTRPVEPGTPRYNLLLSLGGLY